MTILWAGGEDIDFQNQVAAGIFVATGSQYRSSYARCSLKCNTATNATVRSNTFPGGAVTSAWLHFQGYNTFVWNNGPFMILGLALTSSGNGSGIYLGNTTGGHLALFKWDGTTLTQLAAGTATLATSTPVQFDINLANYGSSSTVSVYVNGGSSADVSYSGSTAISGVSNLDCVGLAGNSANVLVSEIIVADSDTRTMSLATLAPNAAGDSVGSWTNTYTSINPTTINDANAVYNNASGSDFLCNVTDLPSGSFSILAVKEIIRAEVTAGSTTTGVKLGIKSGGTINVDSGHSPGAAWTQYERLMATNPVTSAAFTPSEINALQLDLQSV